MILVLCCVLHILTVTRCSIVFDVNNQAALNNKYCQAVGNCLPGQHVMCMYGDKETVMGPRCGEGQIINMTKSEEQYTLDVINGFRSNLALGKETGKNNQPLPRGYSIRRLEWSEELALFAHVWANQCDPRMDYCRSTEFFPYAGQALSLVQFHYPNWDRSNKEFKDKTPKFTTEKRKYVIDYHLNQLYSQKKAVTEDMIRTPKTSGNKYMMMVQGRNTHIGCAMSTYVDYYETKYDTPVIFYTVQFVCNFSNQPRSNQTIYETSTAQGLGWTPCGCSLDLYEDDQCLCVRNDSKVPDYEDNDDKPNEKGKKTDQKGDNSKGKGDNSKGKDNLKKGDNSEKKGNNSKGKGDYSNKKGDSSKEKGDDSSKKDNNSREKGDDSNKKGNNSKGKGDDSNKKGDNSKGKGDDSNKKGNNSKGKGDDSNKKGNNSKGKGDDSNKKGDNSKGKGDDSNKKGNNSKGKGDDSNKKGDNSKGKGDDSNKKGNNSKGKGDDSNKKGDNSKGKGDDSNEKGNNSKGKGDDSSKKGNNSKGKGDDSNKKHNNSREKRDDSNDKGNNSEEKRDDSKKKGDSSKEKGDDSKKKGNNSKENGGDSNKKGNNSEDKGDDSKNKGDNSKEKGDDSKNKGDNSKDNGDDSEKKGNDSKENGDKPKEKDKYSKDKGDSSKEKDEYSKEKGDSSHENNSKQRKDKPPEMLLQMGKVAKLSNLEMLLHMGKVAKLSNVVPSCAAGDQRCKSPVVVMPIFKVENANSEIQQQVQGLQTTFMPTLDVRKEQIRQRIRDRVQNARDRYFSKNVHIEPGTRFSNGGEVGKGDFAMSTFESKPYAIPKLNHKETTSANFPLKIRPNINIKPRKDFSNLEELVSEYLLYKNNEAAKTPPNVVYRRFNDIRQIGSKPYRTSGDNDRSLNYKYANNINNRQRPSNRQIRYGVQGFNYNKSPFISNLNDEHDQLSTDLYNLEEKSEDFAFHDNGNENIGIHNWDRASNYDNLRLTKQIRHDNPMDYSSALENARKKDIPSNMAYYERTNVQRPFTRPVTRIQNSYSHPYSTNHYDYSRDHRNNQQVKSRSMLMKLANDENYDSHTLVYGYNRRQNRPNDGKNDVRNYYLDRLKHIRPYKRPNSEVSISDLIFRNV